eukprot:10770079-Lingulodinium_polyedra.AAC.1
MTAGPRGCPGACKAARASAARWSSTMARCALRAPAERAWPARSRRRRARRLSRTAGVLRARASW